MAQTSQPDYLDPALGYTVNAIEPFFVVYNSPYWYPHVEGEEGKELIPVLAEEDPEISEDGLEYKFTFREGLEYSDGTPLKASDFEHAIKRVLTLESGGSAFYLSSTAPRSTSRTATPRRTFPASRPTTRRAR